MKQGFTLIETVVAIFLLTVGVAGSFALMQRVSFSASFSASQLVASYLAQEGIEIIRNIRDTNYLQDISWDSGINGVADFRLDYRSDEFPDATCGAYLRHDGDFYVCSGDSSSKFQRQIIIEKPAPDKMVISVQVSWSERGIAQQVSSATELYNWR